VLIYLAISSILLFLIIPVDSYTDEHYNVTLSIDKDGRPKIERIYGNQRLSDLKGALKVFVKDNNSTNSC
jgi:hypothetical protein